jgi:hypothetical protein
VLPRDKKLLLPKRHASLRSTPGLLHGNSIRLFGLSSTLLTILYKETRPNDKSSLYSIITAHMVLRAVYPLLEDQLFRRSRRDHHHSPSFV